MLDGLAGARQLAVAAALGQQVDDHRARLHPLDGGARDDARRRAARHAGGRDHAVGRGDAPVEHVLLLRLFLGGQFARIAAGALGGDARLDELRTERAHLLARRAADVVGLDHGAEPLRGRDRLQARDARADHEHGGRADRARGGRQHREELVERGRADQHGLVAGDRRLRGQRVHRLRARDARHELHGEAGDAPFLQRAHQRGLVVRREEAGDGGAVLELRDQGGVRRLHREEEVGRGEHGVRAVGQGDVLVLGVGKARRGARAALDQDPGAGPGQAGGDFRYDCDAVLTSHGLFQHADRDWHPVHPLGLAGRAAAR